MRRRFRTGLAPEVAAVLVLRVFQARLAIAPRGPGQQMIEPAPLPGLDHGMQGDVVESMMRQQLMQLGKTQGEQRAFRARRGAPGIDMHTAQQRPQADPHAARVGRGQHQRAARAQRVMKAAHQQAGVGRQVDRFAADHGVVGRGRGQRRFEVMHGQAPVAIGRGRQPGRTDAIEFDIASGRRAHHVAQPAAIARRVQHTPRQAAAQDVEHHGVIREIGIAQRVAGRGVHRVAPRR